MSQFSDRFQNMTDLPSFSDAEFTNTMNLSVLHLKETSTPGTSCR